MNTSYCPTDLCVHDLVGAKANAMPHAIAVVAADKQLTYGELNARANQLAHLLRSFGVGPDSRVGLCVRRSVDLVIGALGILKAGGAYVPLDPAYPSNRLSMLLEDSDARLLVTQSSVASQLPPGNWRTVMLDSDAEVVKYPSVAPVSEAKAEDLAYVIFTSGSTGRPKGVQITHANLLNLVFWHQRTFKITPADRATLQASPGFDAAVWELWPYLAAGASLYLVDEEVRNAPESLRDWMTAKGITISFLPTAIAQYMIDLQWPSESLLRVLLTGADTLYRHPPANLPFAFVNNYGPTECTVVATSGTVASGIGRDELPSIGSPIDNTQVYVVDASLNPVPAGAQGELLIGGRSVARGYLNLPDLTAEKFIPDPFSKDPAARLYRTGDLGRYLPNGEIAFLGRIDEQIKIRGYRIEPQEISAVLERHPAVKTSLVAAHTDVSGEKRLVAYVVATGDGRLKAGALRKFLSDYLPDYMTPSTFVQLEVMPLSAHGKLDRACLPEPTEENTLQDDSYEAPRSPIEERVASIVETLLGVKRVGIDDDFFNMGGHSLLGAQMVVRIRDAFGVALSLRSLFDDPTVRGMSAEIERLILEKLESMTEDEAQRLLGASEKGATV